MTAFILVILLAKRKLVLYIVVEVRLISLPPTNAECRPLIFRLASTTQDKAAFIDLPGSRRMTNYYNPERPQRRL
jgi:hypothetical protein